MRLRPFALIARLVARWLAAGALAKAPCRLRRHFAGAACDGAVNKLSAGRGERLASKRAVSGNRTSRFVVPRVYIRVIRLSKKLDHTRSVQSPYPRVIFVIAETPPEGLRSRAADRPCREARRSTPTTTTSSCVWSTSTKTVVDRAAADSRRCRAPAWRCCLCRRWSTPSCRAAAAAAVRRAGPSPSRPPRRPPVLAARRHATSGRPRDARKRWGAINSVYSPW